MILALILHIVVAASAQTQPTKLNYAVNGGFENGLADWKVVGKADVLQEGAIEGKSSARLGPGKASVSQRYDVPGLRVLLISAKARAGSPVSSGLLRAKCFDAKGKKLMELSSDFGDSKLVAAKGTESALYFKTHAYTAYLVLSIECSKGTLLVDSVDIQDDDKSRVEHAPLCDLDQYMRPIWRGDTAYNETVLMLSQGSGAASGRLLYEPSKILSVRDSALGTEFKEGRDFEVDGRKLTCLPGSSMPITKDSEIPKENYPWLNLGGRHVVVTYKHVDIWKGPIPLCQGDHLAATLAKLQAKKPLRIVTLGDSITLGINVSGFRNDPPYMPTWAELFARGLRKSFGYEQVHVFNVGLGGMTASWGELNAKESVASLKPDLVAIAFGMNDFWSVEPPAFKASIERIMKTIRASTPGVEFILISSIGFDPDYTHEAVYVGHMKGYAESLRSLVGPGVALLDMSAMSAALYEAKSAKDLMTDPMHPDDFLARWYAQGLVTMLDSRIK